MYTVIDVSRYTTITDYKKVANKVDGVIIRAGYRSYGSSGTLQKDSAFDDHYTNFFGFTKIGVYWFTQAITTAEAIEEAEFLYSIIKGKNISFPIYIDSEYSNSTQQGRADSLTVEERTSLIKVFLDKMKELGYKAGVYAEDTWFIEHLNYASLLAEEYSIWVAKYSKILSPEIPTYDGWQFSNTESMSGISGDVNMSYFYKDVAGWKEVRPVYEYIQGLEGYLYNYTGEEITPAVISSSLTEDVDYSVTYVDNINAGTATVIVKGINSYSGTVSLGFVISPIELIGEAKVIGETEIEFTGLPIKPSISVGSMVPETDYITTYLNNINIGTATAIATGINNYTGTRSVDFTITKQSIADRTITLLKKKYKYTGEEIKPVIVIEGLIQEVDFTVEYSNNINVGTATIMAVGKGNYKDYCTTTFIIESFNLADYNMTLDPVSFAYTGEARIPEVKIENVDSDNYDITYPENPIESGLYYITATGKNEYFGTNTKSYTILNQSISAFTPILEYYIHNYVSNYLTPKVTIEGLTENVDFTVEYTDNYNVGTARATVFGIGNYNGSTYAEFEIVESKITNCVGKFGKPSFRTPYRVLDDEGFKLYASLGMYKKDTPLIYDYDYTITKTDMVLKDNFYLYSFYVKGLYSFSGNAVFRFRIINEEPSDPIDTTDDGVYNFGDIDLGDETAQGDYDFASLDDGIDPETVVIDGKNYDFEIYSQIYLSDYDIDDGLNIDADGHTADEASKKSDDDDDGVFNFGDIDLGDETAVGDYDFGDLDEGVDPESVADDDYDFNVLSGDKEEGYAEGTEFELDNTPVYALYSSRKVSFYASGTYYIYRSIVCENKIRITKFEDGVHEPVRASGWVKMDDLAKLDKFAVGDCVLVNGDMYQYANGTGGYTTKANEIMYITSVEDGYEYPYALSSSLTTIKQGFVNSESLTKLTD